MSKTFPYVHVDVFADRQLRGNGLAVVFCDRFPDDETMLDLAREFKQFETIFVSEPTAGRVVARIFTVEEELPFAGHPVLGAMAALHDRHAQQASTYALRFALLEKEVPVVSTRTVNGFHAEMQQGTPAFEGEVPSDDLGWLTTAHNLTMEQLSPGLPVEVVSTGLPYVLIPIQDGLANARITVQDLEKRIASYGASFTYLFDPKTLEARTWDNRGLVEDCATGSAAGPVCAYLVRHGRLREGETVTIHQGQYANRPGVLHAIQRDGIVYVSGDVTFFARGSFTLS